MDFNSLSPHGFGNFFSELGNYVPKFAVLLLLEPIKLRMLKRKFEVQFQIANLASKFEICQEEKKSTVQIRTNSDHKLGGTRLTGTAGKNQRYCNIYKVL